MRDAIDIEPHGAAESRSHDPAVEMAALAARQYGVVARRQLVALGLGRHVIARNIRRARLHVVHRGVYAVGHRSLTREGRWLAAVFAGGDGAVLSHRSAAALWGLPAGPGGRVEISTTRERRHGQIVSHVVRLPADEVTVHRNIPVTTPARTLFDLAAVLPEDRLARAAERAEGLRLASPTSLAALAARYPRRPGVAAVRRIAGDVTGILTRSDLEDRFVALLAAENLPRPLVNAPVDLPDTDDPEADITWPTQRLIVELDGYETHSTRAAFERDRARDRALQAQGWRVVRITWRQLADEPQTIAAQLRALLSRS